VVAYQAAEHPPGAALQCTYISIPQAPRTLAVVLSKPTWMWGAEMGANSEGVVVGNEAVWTVEDSDGPAGLLGMDLVRWVGSVGRVLPRGGYGGAAACASMSRGGSVHQ
jgi:secernin